MAEQSNRNGEVTEFLDNQKHPFRNEIEQLRMHILSSNAALRENIKWNGPNYSFANEDIITMNIQPPKKQILLVFHRGAKKKIQPKQKLISNNSTMLVWKENDRAIMTFKSLQDIENAKVELINIVTKWIHANNKTNR